MCVSRACFKKNSSLHISQKNFSTTFFRILPEKFLNFPLKNSDDFFFFFFFFFFFSFFFFSPPFFLVFSQKIFKFFLKKFFVFFFFFFFFSHRPFSQSSRPIFIITALLN